MLSFSILAILAVWCSSISGFAPLIPRTPKSMSPAPRSSTRVQIFPQAVFAASCAGAVVAYVYFNIGELPSYMDIYAATRELEVV
jgi:hypothetical protein